jgi:ubiquitin-protein ligase
MIFRMRPYILLLILSSMPSSLCTTLPSTTLVTAPSALLSSAPTPLISKRKKKRRKKKTSSIPSVDATAIKLDDYSDLPTPSATISTDTREGRSQISDEDKESIDTISRDNHSKTSERNRREKSIKDRDSVLSPATSKKEKIPITSRPAKRSSINSNGIGKDRDCLRRIKREWKEIVHMGIAYDWTNMRTIQDHRNSNRLSSTESDRDYVRIGPFNKNMLRWHFSIKGPVNSAYEEGVYHGLILLPKNYPAMPPRIQMLTPNGRFITNVDICLSASNYHPETWTPKWTMLSLVNALRLHMLTLANEIGGMISSDEIRKRYATESLMWRQTYSCVGSHCNGEGVVVVDHGHMIASGVFKISSAIPAMTTTERAENSNKSLFPMEDNINTHKEQVTATNDVKVHPCYIEGETSEINNDELSDKRTSENCDVSSATIISSQLVSLKSTEEPKIKQTKKKSIRRKSKSQKPIIKSKVAKDVDAATAKKDKGSNKGEGTLKEIASIKKSTIDQQLNGCNISKGFFKRLIDEVLKLPLRIMRFILKVLLEVESRLRAIINSFSN